MGMIAMQFFYMEDDFYAGQFTKRAVPVNFLLNRKRAIFLSILFDKHQQRFQSLLIRNFEKAFKLSKIKTVPILLFFMKCSKYLRYCDFAASIKIKS